jgi:hypothetical protein
VLQLLKGNAAIPNVFGYGREARFEYMAMELLGLSIAKLQTDGAGVKVETVIRVLYQAVSRFSRI